MPSIPLVRTDSPEVKDLKEWLDGKPGRYQVKYIRFFVERTGDGESVLVDTSISGKVRDATGRITSLGLVEQKVSCNGISKGTSETAVYSPFVPDVIQRRNGRYFGKMRVLSPYFSKGRKDSNDPNLSYVPSVSGSLNQRDLQPTTEDNIFNMFNQKDGLYGHQSKIYRVSKDEIELRNVSLPYSNIRRHLVVTYEFK